MMTTAKNSFWILAMLGFALAMSGCSRPDPGLFETPEAAVQALSDLIGKHDDQAIEAIFGPGSPELFHSGDDDADRADAARVKEMILAKVAFEDFDDNTKIALFGEDAWPWPIPLINDGKGWRFNTAEGREELVNRRVGRNELWTLSAMHEIVDAQREYHAVPRDGNPQAFAQFFISSEGKQDGLYWPTADGEEPSPLGDLAAESDATRDDPQPFHGYFYKLLRQQGTGAPGGERSYLDAAGLLTGGFAVIAWPAKYGNSGVMTFITNHRGLVWQKDLGADTATIAAAVDSYDPDASWSPTSDFMVEMDSD